MRPSIHARLYNAGLWIIRTFRRDLSLAARIYLAAAITVLSVTALFFVTFRTQTRIVRVTNDVLDRRVAAMEAAQHTKEALVSHNNTLLRFVATRDRQQLASAEEWRQTAKNEVDALSRLASNPVLVERLSLLRTEMERYFEDANRLIAYSERHELPADAGLFRAAEWARDQDMQRKELALMSAEGQSRLQHVFALCEEVVTFNRAELARARVEMDAVFRGALRTAAVFIAITAFVVIVVSIGLAASLIGSFRALLDGVRRMEEGDLSFEIPVFSAGELGRLTAAFNRMAKTVREQRERLLRETITDDLTGAYNHRYFRKLLRTEFDRAGRTGDPLSLLMIDIDHFKNYNDSQGHERGNEVLRRTCAVIRENLRNIDILVRYGGDELAVLLPKADPDEARIIAERLILAMSTCRFPGQEAQPLGRVTLSVGGASHPRDASSPNDLLTRADQALYAAKGGGRNCARWATDSGTLANLA